MKAERRARQSDRVLDYIIRYGSITQAQALSDLGVMRLAARIADLKGRGVAVRSRTATAKNIYGETVRFSEYYLEENKNGEFQSQ